MERGIMLEGNETQLQVGDIFRYKQHYNLKGHAWKTRAAKMPVFNGEMNTGPLSAAYKHFCSHLLQMSCDQHQEDLRNKL